MCFDLIDCFHLASVRRYSDGMRAFVRAAVGPVAHPPVSGDRVIVHMCAPPPGAAAATAISQCVLASSTTGYCGGRVFEFGVTCCENRHVIAPGPRGLQCPVAAGLGEPPRGAAVPARIVRPHARPLLRTLHIRICILPQTRMHTAMRALGWVCARMRECECVCVRIRECIRECIRACAECIPKCAARRIRSCARTHPRSLCRHARRIRICVWPHSRMHTGHAPRIRICVWPHSRMHTGVQAPGRARTGRGAVDDRGPSRCTERRGRGGAGRICVGALRRRC